MNDEVKGFIAFLILVVIIAVSLIINDGLTDSKIQNLIRNGADPVAVACAYRRMDIVTCTHIAGGEL